MKWEQERAGWLGREDKQARVKRVVEFGGVGSRVWNEREVVDGAVWFWSLGNVRGGVSVGLRVKIVQRMKWEQERAGWLGREDKQARVKRVVEFGGVGEWRKFGCHVLVERFVLKRMDGSLVMTYDFMHTHQIKIKWE
ncbi:unnamed protein product [Ilex paraguariensis]|uniref:Uncharacterized protein n=1 Tax=Ilex paraguariensis TaxID=185542 RepID=A0ABC8SKA7_9AQUA